MVVLYNITLFLFYGFVFIIAFFNKKLRLWLSGRNGLLRNLKKQFAFDDKVMWMHCSSLGEFEQGRPLLEEFRKANPDYKIVLTFFSPSGYELCKTYEQADVVSYIPLDTWINARRFIKIIHPNIVFFIKYDFWYHHLHQAKKQGAKLYLISSLFRSKQVFFKWYGSFFRSMLYTFTKIFVQNEDSKNLLSKIGISNTVLSGDTRIDRVKKISLNATKYPLIEQFINNNPCLVCGSTWLKDEELIAQSVSVLPSGSKIIIAPHVINESHINQINDLFVKRYSVVRYTQIRDINNLKNHNVLILDTIGMLSSVYRFAKIAYIGGGFEDSIHNTLEAVVFGKPVVFGPNYSKFIEANDLLKLGGAVSINKKDDLQRVFENWFKDETSYLKASKVCKNYIWEQPNVTENILKNL